MTVTEVAYCTRAQVQRALNLADIPRLNARVDGAIMAGARQVHGLLHRRFYPLTATRLFDLPQGYTLWLNENELAAAPTTVTSNNVAMTLNRDYILYPIDGPPYQWIDQSFTATVPWQPGASTQQAIGITADYGYPTDTVAATTLGLTAGSGVTTIIVNDSSRVGVGSLVLIDSERLILSDVTVSTTGATLAADLTNSKAANSITVSSGTLVNPGEMILIDSERMFVEYVAGNVLTVDRAVNGSVLAAHTTGAVLYAGRTFTVLRGRLGTSAASHNSGTAVSLLNAPSLISELNLAYAINNNQAALSAYSRTAGPDTTSIYRDRGRGIQDLEADALTAYGRQMRTRVAGQ